MEVCRSATAFALCVTLLASGCRDRHEPAGELADRETRQELIEHKPPTTGTLWDLAPAVATAGVVVDDGAITTLLATWREIAGALADPAGSWPPIVELEARVASWIGVDRLDAAGLEGAGFDLASGAAIFFDQQLSPLLLVLPVADPTAFVTALGGSVEREGSRQLYHLLRPQLVCTVAASRFLCARELAVIDAAVTADRRPLTVRRHQLPEPLWGEVELIGDLRRIPDLAAVRAKSSIILDDPGLLVVSLRLRDQRASLRGWIEGEPAGPWGTLLVEPTISAIDELVPGATGKAHFRLAPERLASLADGLARLGAGGDLQRDLLGLLTGEVGIFTAGRGDLAGVVALGITDRRRVAAAIPTICDLFLQPLGRIERLDDEQCQVVLQIPAELARAPFAGSLLASASGARLRLWVREQLLLLEVGEGLGGASGVAPGSRLGPGWQLMLRGRSLDPLATMTPAIEPAVGQLLGSLGQDRQLLVTRVRWALAQLAEIEAGIRFGELPSPESGEGMGLVGGGSSRGLHLHLIVTPFAADPAEVYQRYRAAIGEMFSGDSGGFRAAMAEIAAKYPNSLAGGQARLLVAGSPMVGPGTLLAVAVGIPFLQAYLDGAEPSPTGADR